MRNESARCSPVSSASSKCATAMRITNKLCENLDLHRKGLGVCLHFAVRCTHPDHAYALQNSLLQFNRT
jgi:hypothetical protein